MSFNSTTLFLAPQWYLLFPCFPMFSFGANKEYLLHVTHRIISTLLFGWNSSFSRLFQHFMSLTYKHEMNFLFLGMNIFFLLHYDLHLFELLNTKWCSFHYVCIVWKKTIERINGPKKERCIIFLNVFVMFLNFWSQNYFDMCFDNLIKCIASLLYSACCMISTHLYLYKNAFNDMGINLQKREKKNLSIYNLHICAIIVPRWSKRLNRLKMK